MAFTTSISRLFLPAATEVSQYLFGNRVTFVSYHFEIANNNGGLFILLCAPCFYGLFIFFCQRLTQPTTIHSELSTSFQQECPILFNVVWKIEKILVIARKYFKLLLLQAAEYNS